MKKFIKKYWFYVLTITLLLSPFILLIVLAPVVREGRKTPKQWAVDYTLEIYVESNDNYEAYVYEVTELDNTIMGEALLKEMQDEGWELETFKIYLYDLNSEEQFTIIVVVQYIKVNDFISAMGRFYGYDGIHEHQIIDIDDWLVE